MQDDIKLESIASKVVIGFVLDRDVFEGQVGDKRIQNVVSLFVVVVHISISAYKKNSIRILSNKLFDTYFEFSHVSNELRVLAMCGEVYPDMD